MQDEKKIPRGIRNNNPLNIRRAKTPWYGETYFKKSDLAFCQFQTLELGWRAAFYLLRKKMLRIGWASIRDIITEWAPPIENNTEKYINFVSKDMDLKPDFKIHADNDTLTFYIACSMCAYENGMKYHPCSNPEWERVARRGKILNSDIFVLQCYLRDLGDKIEVYDWGV